MLSGKQRQKALKKNIEHAHNMARDLRAEDADDVTLTYYDNEESFRAMKLPEEGDDFGFRQLVTAETAKVMLEHGLRPDSSNPEREGIFRMAWRAREHLSGAT